MATGLPACAIETHDFAVFARQMLRSDRTGNRSLSSKIVVLKVIEGKRANNDRQKLGCLAVIGHVDALPNRAIRLVLFRISMALVVDECACDTQIDAAAGVDINPTITRHHSLARQTKLRLSGLVTEAVFHSHNRFFDGDESLELFGS